MKTRSPKIDFFNQGMIECEILRNGQWLPCAIPAEGELSACDAHLEEYRTEILSTRTMQSLVQIPDQAAINAKNKALREIEIKEARRAEYGSIEDQLDEIYHNFDAWRARIRAVKEKYPKQ